MHGTLVGTSQSDLLAKIEALEAAYTTEGQDLVVLASDGETTLRQLDSSASVAGTQIEPITYPGGEAPEKKHNSLTASYVYHCRFERCYC